MKKRLTGYTFNAASKTVTHADFSDVGLAGIQLITNVTDGIIIYQFNEPSKGGTLATDTLTLDYDTTSMDNADDLMVLVDDAVTTQTISGTVTANAGTNLNTSSLATSTNITGGGQKSQIVDGSGNVIGATSNALDVNIKSGASSGTQYTEGDTDTTITGTAVMWEDASDTLRAVSAAKPLPVDIQDSTVAVTQSGTWNVNNVSGTVSLPTGASTAAKQPALGTAGTASSDVITVQGIASMTALKTDSSATTQPVSGTVTADTELPTASTLADSTSSPTAPAVGAFGLVRDRNAGSWSQQTAVSAASKNTSGVGVAAAGILGQFDDTSPGTVTEDSFGNLRMSTNRNLYGTIRDAAGNERGANVNASNQLTVSVDNNPVLGAGTNAIGKLAANSGVDIGDVDVASIAAGTNAIGNVGIIPRTSGGLTTYHLVSAATTNATVVKASAGQLFGWYIYNSNAAARKLVFHNSASTPTAGASVYFSLVIPPSSGANVFSDTGMAFSSGIAITTVTGLADSDSTAVAANDLVINLWYS